MNASEPSIQHDSIRCTLNGKAIELPHRSLHQMMVEQGVNPEKPGIAVAVNDTVVRRSDWKQTELADGDHVEVITAMQGG
ncbi:MAG: sulfur carrier protein ThiS [Ignavibacteriae bacterium]|nr:sulfur carrier protein ThiS [Ignavibacteriota bacterium]MCB9217383.1 sulfur carrier protein ThiS [Ignavibacteria bacterium]